MIARPFSLPRALLFTALALVAIHVQLLPLEIAAESTVLPELLLVLAAAWSLREPENLPLPLLAAALLLGDLVLDRAVGLWALTSLLVLEVLRLRREALYDRPFAIEWATFAGILAVALALHGLVLRLALIDVETGGLGFRLWLSTVLAYPLMAAFLHWVLRVRAPKPAERSRRLGRVA
ncbi:rod shape-determining protein MreD [Halovulum dunhuangense]|uniref:Rod shape-determining protein MreD n=1 Tax=Halovulum dunhuangense TaxID=1505036 RepID=A0A849L0U8_9RHOB|nr:rod shape-determining protein MreD [Halovulum dunhuangense]NNU79902.1 rod shape-determining protein MreD [Halovulum dunhuangense]